MRIKKLKLYTNKLDREKEFYGGILGVEIIENQELKL